MQDIDPNAPIFQIYSNDRHVATMFDPRVEEMFWCSYRIEPVDANGDLVIHDSKTWEHVAFEIRDMRGDTPNPKTFSGGFEDFCDRKTDRLAFRSLWPPIPSLASRIFTACATMFGYNQRKREITKP